MTSARSSLFALLVLSACRVEPIGGPPFTGSGDPEPGSEPPDPPARGGTGSTSGGSGSTPAAGASGSAGFGGEPSSGCDGETITLDEVRSGLVIPSATIELAATATSQKFLLSETQAGSCLWGAFVGDEPAGDEPRGILVVSYGNEAPGEARCEPGTDAIPDDLAPGDLVRVVGRASSFAPASCDAIVPVAQLLADARCPFERRGRATPIEPVVLPLDVSSALARGSDDELVRAWAGGLVRLENVSALPNEAGDGAVRSYGVLALAETELEVHADIEYGDLSGKGPRDAAKSLDFGYPTLFRSVTGLVHLDYCDFSLAPRKRCEDFDPPSLDCP
jgi:hypothetical protein